jgi:hypothetical protein
VSLKFPPLRIETGFTGTQRKFLLNLNYRHVDHSQTARKEIAGFGLSGHHAKEVKNWHENHVIHEMKTNPALKGHAQSATIQCVSISNYLWINYSFISVILLTRVEATRTRRITSLPLSITNTLKSFPIASTAGCVLSYICTTRSISNNSMQF